MLPRARRASRAPSPSRRTPRPPRSPPAGPSCSDADRVRERDELDLLPAQRRHACPSGRSLAASIAAMPQRVASTRSNAVGVPPRWTWPSTVARVSKPVRASTSRSSTLPDAAEALVAELVLVAARASRASPRAGSRPRRPRRSRSSARARGGASDGRQTSSMSNGRSGIRITSAPPAMPGVEGDPARVPAHHLHDQDPVVALGGRVQPVDRVGRDLHGGVEAERHVRAVRGRCRSSSARRAPARRASCSSARPPSVSSPPIAISPSSEQRLHVLPDPLEPRPRASNGLVRDEREDRAAAGQDPAHRLDRELDRGFPRAARASRAEAEIACP